jgi:hypothetical protein
LNINLNNQLVNLHINTDKIKKQIFY